MKLQKILVAVSLLAIPVIGFMAYSAASAPLPEGFPPPTTGGKIHLAFSENGRCIELLNRNPDLE